MAGRIRTLKPEILEDAVTAGLTHAAFRLFVGMVLLADDHGNLRANPRWLEGQVFHGCELGDLDGSIGDLMTELGRKLVEFYEVDNQRYAHLAGWLKHQRIDNAMEPRVPLPPGWVVERIEWAGDRRKRARWVSRLATVASTSPAVTATVASTSSRNLPPWQTATDDTSRSLPPPDPDPDPDPDVDVERSAPPAPPETVTKSGPESAVLSHLTDADFLARADGLTETARRIAGKLSALAPENRWGDLAAEVAGWVDHARKALQGAKDAGQHWSPERALAEVESKANQRIRYRPKDARMDRERERNRATQWKDGTAKSPAALETHDLDAEIADADRKLAADRAKHAAEPKVDPAQMAELTRKVLAKFGRAV